MSVNPERVEGNMTSGCTCGHCRVTHVQRETETARVYKVQLPGPKTKKRKTPPKKAVAPQTVRGRNAVKGKPQVKKANKSVVRSKPYEYDAWHFGEADLRTIAHSNMQEATTQTVVSCQMLDLGFARKKSEDKAVQFGHGDKGEEARDLGSHRDAVSSVMDDKQAAGDFGNPITNRDNPKTKFKPVSSENIISMLPNEKTGPDDSVHERLFDICTRKLPKSKNHFIPSDFDDALNMVSRKLGLKSAKNVKEIFDPEKTCRPNATKIAHHQNELRASKIESAVKIPRKILATSLRMEKDARKLLNIENSRLSNCISKAEQEVNDMRLSLSELSNTIKNYRAKGRMPYVAKVEKLEKLVDDLTIELRSSKVNGGKPVGDVKGNCVVMSVNVEGAAKGEDGSRKMDPGKWIQEDGSRNVARSGSTWGKFDWSRRSSVSSVSSGTVSSCDTSLTALKTELGKFFEEMCEDTEKLIEEAELHHMALSSFGLTTNTSSYGGMSSSSSTA